MLFCVFQSWETCVLSISLGIREGNATGVTSQCYTFFFLALIVPLVCYCTVLLLHVGHVWEFQYFELLLSRPTLPLFPRLQLKGAPRSKLKRLDAHPLT